MEDLAKLYFGKYKEFFLPICLILIAFFIFFQVTVPQFSSISEIQAQIEKKKTLIASLQTTIDTLNSFSDAQVTDNLTTANRALPSSKEIVTVFSTLTSVASKTNVDIEEFSLRVGGIYSKDKKVKLDQVSVGAPSLRINVGVKAVDFQNIIHFSEGLYTVLPVAEVKVLKTSSDTGDLEINFYYQQYDLAQIATQEMVAPLSQKEQSLLKLLEEWKNN